MMSRITKTFAWIALACVTGCRIQPPGGPPIVPRTHGSAIDQLNLTQENNAEAAKLVIFNHEFENNLQDSPQTAIVDQNRPFEFQNPNRIRGLRLNADGLEHVQQIADFLVHHPPQSRPTVVVERSRNSRKWETEHHYPVHFNPELDDLRRQLIVNVLLSFGIENATELVVIAPAFSTGLSAEEAAAAYQNSRFQSTGVNAGGFGGFGGLNNGFGANNFGVGGFGR